MEIRAIDIHIHLSDEVSLKARGDRGAQLARYMGYKRQVISVDEMADLYRKRKMMAAIMNTTDETITGLTPVPNDHIAEAVRKHPDVFLGFGIVDPWEGKLAISEVRRCREELGLHGIGEFNAARQHFFPNDRRFYPLWEEIQKLAMPVLFHSGLAAAGAGMPGGMGTKLKYTRPIYLDDVAADFPELQIISAHPSWPWQQESLAICRHKSNVYIDLSGWAPKYFSSELVHYVNTLIQDKVLFGSDWPAITPERWLQEFDELSIRPEVRHKVLLDNARRLFKLSLH